MTVNVITESRATLLIEIGTVYGPPATRYSVPGDVTMICAAAGFTAAAAPGVADGGVVVMSLGAAVGGVAAPGAAPAGAAPPGGAATGGGVTFVGAFAGGGVAPGGAVGSGVTRAGVGDAPGGTGKFVGGTPPGGFASEAGDPATVPG